MQFDSIHTPDSLPDRYKEAVNDHVGRLVAATKAHDLAAVVGCAKELAESVARIVLGVRGESPPSKAKFRVLINDCHDALDRQPGEGLGSADEDVSRMAQALKNLVTPLSDLRNRVGTGHGRATVAPVLEEQALVAVNAAWLWAEWCLRRLPSYILGDSGALIERLRSGIFYKGDLSAHLAAIKFHELSEADQTAVGVAVGRRAVGGTFVVWREGVEPLLNRSANFPTRYRAGVRRGLLIDENGALSTTKNAVEEVLQLVMVEEDPDLSVSELANLISESTWTSLRVPDPPRRSDVVAFAQEAARVLPVATRETWQLAWESHVG